MPELDFGDMFVASKSGVLNMKQVICCAIAIVLCGLIGGAGEAQDAAKIIERGKKATALVDIQSREFGTAFCIDASGMYVTNAHVVRRAAHGGKVSLVVDPGESSQKVLQAAVIRVDEKQDLALLLTDGEAEATALQLGSASAIHETANVTAFGYPFGRLLAERGANDYPSITVSTGHVTSLRKLKGELQHIQLDASLNPGNSGGPVLDQEGRVIGIVQAGVPGSGVNFAIPVDKLASLLEAPQVSFDPPNVPYSARHDERDFVIKAISLGSNKDVPLTVKLTLRNGQAERTVIARQESDGYHARAVPAPAPKRTARVQVVAEYADGTISGWLHDRSVHCGSRELKLSDVQRIDTRESTQVVLNSGESITGKLNGLESADLDLGGALVQADLGKATSVRFSPEQTEYFSVGYKVTVARGEKVVAETSGSFQIENAPVASSQASTPTAAGPAPVNLPQDKVRMKLPAVVDDVVVGGAGRYLILPMRKLSKIAVFDVTAAKITHYLPLVDSDALVSAGMDKLIIVLPEQKILQRWSLDTFQRELTQVLPVGGTVQCMAIGSASNGPLMMRCMDEGPGNIAQYTFVNINTLRAIPQLKIDGQWLNFGPGGHIRASASGDTFGVWNAQGGLGLVTVEGTKAETHFNQVWTGFVVPGPDGRFVFTGTGGVLTQQLHKMDPNETPNVQYASIPSTSLNYYLRLPFRQMPVPGQLVSKLSVSLYMTGTDTPLTTLPDLDELGPPQDQPLNDFTIDKRVLFMPTADLLITVPMTNDELVLRKFNVMDQLDKSGIDYLFVSSVPITTAHKGDRYRYAMDVKSKHGGVTCHLDSGPDGMSVSPAGLVTWQIPQSATDSTVIISIKDSSGQEIFHTFTITLP